jgi:hypothetical protein
VAIDLQFDDAMNEKVGGGIMSIGWNQIGLLGWA